MISAVFVCMIFLQAATNDQGPGFACLSLIEANDLALHDTPTILAEVRDVLNRPKIQAKFPHLTPDRIDTFLQKVVAIAHVAADGPDAGITIRDPDDLPYLNLALAANVEYLVSRDKDLLALMDDPAFSAKYPQLRIVEPATFLAAIRRSLQEQ